MREIPEQFINDNDSKAKEGLNYGPESQEFQDSAKEIEAYCTSQLIRIDSEVDDNRAESESLLGAAMQRLHIKSEDPEYQKLKNELDRSRSFLEKLRSKAKILLPLMFGALLAGKGARISQEGTNYPFFEAPRAAEQLEREGITDERKRAYLPHVSELIYKTVIPQGYDTGKKFDPIVQEVIAKIEGDTSAVKGKETLYRSEVNKDREDAWRLYLGLPQRNNTFGVSQYKPERGTDDKYYYSINNWLGKFSEGVKSWLHYIEVPALEKNFNPVKALIGAIQKSKELQKNSWKGEYPADGFLILPGREDDSAYITFDYRSRENEQIPDVGIMGTFKISKGEDQRGHYLSYYDRWDVSGNFVEGESGLFGLPFEIYDRIYYDPSTYKVLSDSNPIASTEYN